MEEEGERRAPGSFHLIVPFWEDIGRLYFFLLPYLAGEIVPLLEEGETGERNMVQESARKASLRDESESAGLRDTMLSIK